MLMIKARLGPSPIAGIGLFADQDIKAGTVTWRFMPGFDQLYSDAELARLPGEVRAQFLTYTYLHEASGKHVYCIDNARFMNHADTPNTAGVHRDGEIEGYDVATRDIAKGEELTCDYHTFDGEVAKKLSGAG
jgi:SET domain-containing protein